MQLLRGSKLIHRLVLAIHRRLLAIFKHCVRHPFKTIFFIFKAYLLLMLFALCLAFSVGSFAQAAPLVCPDGGTPLPGVGGCGQVAPDSSCKLESIKPQGGITGTTQFNSLTSYRNALTATDMTASPPGCSFGTTNKITKIVNTDDLNPQCPSGMVPGEITTETVAITQTKETTSTRRVGSGTVESGPVCSYTETVTPTVWNITATLRWSLSSEVQCPEDYPLGPIPYDDGNLIGNYCYYIPDQPCDCSDLTGSNPQGINYFYAANGTYSQANPPNCISRDDNEDSDIPSCNCKLIATKWSSADVNINGTIYQRWQPIPDQNGVTGVFTGGQCDETEKDTPPDTPEKCYQLGNGQNFCLEDPDQKCARIDGIMTCQAGCGTVNGEFFCFENDDPEEPLPDPDDDITDPDTPLNDMIKRDFKDVLGGTESRLDILARLMSDIKTNTSKGDSDFSAKQDATNRLLKEISDKLDDEGDEEEPTNPQPTYNTDKLEEFVNPNDWSEKNFKTVALAFKDRLMQAPIMEAVQGFFDVSLSGSCPTWQATLDMPFGGPININIDQFCSEVITDLWPAIRGIIVLIFSFLAFRVAFTNE